MTEIIKAISKPREVEAMQFDGSNESAVAICTWVIANGQDAYLTGSTLDAYSLRVVTDAFSDEVCTGYYVVKLRKYDFEVCSASYFDENYDKKE